MKMKKRNNKEPLENSLITAKPANRTDITKGMMSNINYYEVFIWESQTNHQPETTWALSMAFRQ